MPGKTAAPVSEPTQSFELREPMNPVFPQHAPPQSAWSAGIVQGHIQRFREAVHSESMRESSKSELISLSLAVGVPFVIADIYERGEVTAADLDYCEAVGKRLASQGDRLQFRSKAEWHDATPNPTPENPHPKKVTIRYYSSAELMTMFVQACGVMAFAPGGITLFGCHFEARLPDGADNWFGVPSPVPTVPTTSERIQRVRYRGAKHRRSTKRRRS